MNNENEIQNNVENLDITPPLVPNQNIQEYKPEPKKKKSIIVKQLKNLKKLKFLEIKRTANIKKFH